jgi:hypothetical protein
MERINKNLDVFRSIIIFSLGYNSEYRPRCYDCTSIQQNSSRFLRNDVRLRITFLHTDISCTSIGTGAYCGFNIESVLEVWGVLVFVTHQDFYGRTFLHTNISCT